MVKKQEATFALNKNYQGQTVYQGQTAQLELVVVAGTGLSLLGLQQLLE